MQLLLLAGINISPTVAFCVILLTDTQTTSIAKVINNIKPTIFISRAGVSYRSRRSQGSQNGFAFSYNICYNSTKYIIEGFLELEVSIILTVHYCVTGKLSVISAFVMRRERNGAHNFSVYV